MRSMVRLNLDRFGGLLHYLLDIGVGGALLYNLRLVVEKCPIRNYVYFLLGLTLCAELSSTCDAIDE